jgi:TolA-binding protein
MFRNISVLTLLALLAVPTFAPAADKTDLKIAELQRDVASLQDMVKQLQDSQDKKLAGIQAAVQQAADSASHANQAIGAIQTSLSQSLRVQEEKVVTPVVGLSTRMDNLTNDLRTTSNAVSDLGSQISSIKAKLDDISNAIKVINTPPVAPPTPLDSGSAPIPGAGQPTSTIPGGAQPGTATSSTPPMSSSDMYKNAYGDYAGGNYEFALNEFQNFLKYYDDTPLASNSQYYIGMIHYAQGDFPNSVKDFDLVLEKYPENANKNAEAQYYKGLSLLKLNRRNEAETEFRELITHHPRTQMADQSCQRIKELGKTCPVPPAAAPGKKSVSKKN